MILFCCYLIALTGCAQRCAVCGDSNATNEIEAVKTWHLCDDCYVKYNGKTEPTHKEEKQAETTTNATKATKQSIGTTSTTPKSSNYNTTTTTTKLETMGESNAVKTAKNYLNTNLGYSRSGLISQLEFEGYTTTEATYGADNCGANWKSEAVKSAKSYLNTGMGYSKEGLIDQLEFEGFTYEQAAYGVEQNGY